MGPIDKDIEAYVDTALQGGTMEPEEIVLVVMLAMATGKKPLVIQDNFMDAKLAVKQGVARFNSGEAILKRLKESNPEAPDKGGHHHLAKPSESGEVRDRVDEHPFNGSTDE